MKKFFLPLLIVTVIAQISVPVYQIADKYHVLKNGEEVKIKVAPIDPYDAFRGRYVSLWYDIDIDYEHRQGRYGILETDADGFATVKKVVSDKPESGLYIKSRDEDYFNIPLDRYYMEETLAPEAEKQLSGEAEAYVTVRIKEDKAVVSGLYINGIRAEELLKHN